MPTFNRVVLLPTNICNLRCRHCYVEGGSSREEATRYGNNRITALQQVEYYLRQIPALKNVGHSAHFAGGEITLFEKEFASMLRTAQKYGLTMSLVTNAVWARDQKAADSFVRATKKAGLSEIQISISFFHQEFLSIRYAVRALRACRRYGIRAVLRPLITKSHSVAEAIEGIPSRDLEGVSIRFQQCCFVGRARHAVSRNDLFFEYIPYGGCYNCLHLTIRQDGSVYPCCSGSDVTPSLCLGNANGEPLYDIIRRAECNTVFNVLFYQGPRYLAELIKEAGGKDFTCKKYTNICHLCHDLFMDNTVVQRIGSIVYRHLTKKRHPVTLRN